jgi:hypothetical protein
MSLARRVRPDGTHGSKPWGSFGSDGTPRIRARRRAARAPGEVGRGLAVVLLAALAAVVLFAVVAVGSSSDGLGRTVVVGDDGHRRVFVDGELVRFDGFGPEWWAARARALRRRGEARARELELKLERMRRRLVGERRVLLADPSVGEAINLAAATYGNGSTLWRRAGCETGGTYDPRAYNNSSGASGLLQFLPSTWHSTPYGGFSVWSPYANALAGGWMLAHGRGGEWACR